MSKPISYSTKVMSGEGKRQTKVKDTVDSISYAMESRLTRTNVSLSDRWNVEVSTGNRQQVIGADAANLGAHLLRPT